MLGRLLLGQLQGILNLALNLPLQLTTDFDPRWVDPIIQQVEIGL